MKIGLAPMAGFTDWPMRVVAHRFGAAYCHTEMVNARAVGDGAAASLRLLDVMEGEGPAVAHLYGSVPEEFGRAAEAVTRMGLFAGIDINCGCPAPKVAQCGGGAVLMRTPRLIEDIVRAVVKNTSLPVTVKTRLGFNGESSAVFEIVRRVANAGAASVCVHARYVEQFHTGTVHYDVLERLVKESPVPIVGNGGIKDGETARRMRECGVTGMLVGWNAVGNPWIFQKILGVQEFRSSGVQNGNWRVPTVAEVREVLMEHIALCLRHKTILEERYPGTLRVSPEEAVVLDFRCQLFRYLNGIRGVSTLRGRLHGMTTLDQIVSVINEILAREFDYRQKVGRS